LNAIINTFISSLPRICKLNLIQFIVVYPLQHIRKEYSVSCVIPARNEKSNIEDAIVRTRLFGIHQEFILVEGHSTDGTYEEMIKVQHMHPDKDIKVIRQSEKGKGNAVREAFDMAQGDILMILDADLTTPPEDMPKFYEAL